MAAGDSQPEECFPLSVLPRFKSNMRKIRELLRKGVEIGAQGIVTNKETGITYIHPCITDAAKVAAEARFASDIESAAVLRYGFYDQVELCRILNLADLFHEVKCSPSLGIGRFNLDDKTVLVYKDGKISIRQAKDKEDVIHTLRYVSRSLWGAIICTCGNTGVDCASGGCRQCQTRICPVMEGGPPDPTVTKRETAKQTTISAILERVKALETGKRFEEGMEQLDEAFNLFEHVSLKLLKDDTVDDLSLMLTEKGIIQADKIAVQLITETLQVYDAAVGLILSGVAADLSRIVNGLKTLTSSVKKEFSSFPYAQLFSRATTIAKEAYETLRNLDLKGAERIKTRYEELRGTWIKIFEEEPQEELIAIEKIAVNGLYISRLLTRPLPAN
jgi:hypothetical protein